ncbi:jg19847, partial [Pararge aegeria aegeria]
AQGVPGARLREELHLRHQPAHAHQDTQRRKTIQLRRLREDVREQEYVKGSHENTHRYALGDATLMPISLAQ